MITLSHATQRAGDFDATEKHELLPTLPQAPGTLCSILYLVGGSASQTNYAHESVLTSDEQEVNIVSFTKTQ